jgi:dynein heavy chain, axonemal
MKLIMSFMRAYEETEIKRIPEEDMVNLDKSIESLFLFTLVWSIGCTGDYDSRVKFDTFLREKIAQDTPTVQIPDGGSIYEYQYDIPTRSFNRWSDRNKDFAVD